MEQNTFIPDSTAVRVALWRALHTQIDSAPHILQDDIGLKLADPPPGWQERPDMHPQGTAPFRASIVARARFIEDLVIEQIPHGIHQYIVLGAGLDTFAQRHPEVAGKLQVFEVDQPATQAWKKQRLYEIGLPPPAWLHFVPVDFEKVSAWKDQLVAAGYDPKKPVIVTSIGVSMYLTLEAIKKTLRQMTNLAPGSKFLMTFLLPLDLVAPEDRFGFERSIKGAQASGTPFISFFSPEQMLALAREIGFKKIEHLSTSDMTLYFAGRSDGLKPSTGEELLIVTV